MDNVLVEKYRPKTLDDIVGQDSVVSLLKRYVSNGKIPHMMFAGPAGSGKTSCAYALARDFYGDDWREYFYEMNASDERKLRDVREKIKPYAQAKVVDRDFRIIFLDEVDHMSYDAQPALRRIIEKYSNTCRFILSCNYPHKVIEPIKDRCVMFRFKSIPKPEMSSYLKKISKNEGLDITDDGIDRLCELSRGSMRRAIGVLEKLYNADILTITAEVIDNYFCYVKDTDIEKLIRLSLKGNVQSISKFIEKLLIDEAYTPGEIIIAFERLLQENNFLTDSELAYMYEKLGETEFRISVGADPEIQLKTFFVLLYSYIYKNRR